MDADTLSVNGEQWDLGIDTAILDYSRQKGLQSHRTKMAWDCSNLKGDIFKWYDVLLSNAGKEMKENKLRVIPAIHWST